METDIPLGGRDETGILLRDPDPSDRRKISYHLTEKGRDFAPALVGLKDWGKKHMPVRKRAAG